jgi:hypothetical protein
MKRIRGQRSNLYRINLDGCQAGDEKCLAVRCNRTGETARQGGSREEELGRMDRVWIER